MMPRDITRSSRFEARLSPDVLAVIKRAAELQGRSVSDFIVASAQEIAQRTIEDTSIIRLSIEDQRRFVDLLINPPEPNPALQRAAKAHAELIKSQ
jgi:uncharacterized protein (DUF1778 family)